MQKIKHPLNHKKATQVWEESDGTIVVMLYSTEIVRIHKHYITLNHGEKVTRTTTRRMNEVAEHFDLPFRVKVKNGEMVCMWAYRDVKFNFVDGKCDIWYRR